MKRFALSLAAVIVSATLFAQSQATAAKADDVIKFKEATYDFGKIKQNVTVTHEFEFSNVSGKPVIIESAIATCGCTTPTWPQTPVAKGKTEKITTGFTAPTLGKFSKVITVKVAGVATPVQVTIVGEVLSPDDYAKYAKEKGSKKANHRVYTGGAYAFLINSISEPSLFTH